MIRDLVVLGCGGFGREVVEIVSAVNNERRRWNLVGVIDDAEEGPDLDLIQARGLEHLGGLEVLLNLPDSTWAVIAIGSNDARRSLKSQCRGRNWATLIHPDTTLGSDVTVQPGTVIAAGARMSTHIDVGAHVQVDQNSTVGHDSVLGDFCRLSPQACVSGHVSIGSGALVGAAATVLQDLSVGAGSTVGAGAVVVRDVPIATVVKGIPAR